MNNSSFSHKKSQLNIKLDPSLKKKFTEKVKKLGMDTTKVLTAWMEEFVEKDTEVNIKKTNCLSRQTTSSSQVSNLEGRVRKIEQLIYQNFSNVN